MNIPETSQFGDLLKHFRTRRKLTQKALGYKIGDHSRGNIQAWEAGLSHPRERATVLALARVLQLTESEADTLLLAAHHSQEYHTQGMLILPARIEECLYLVDIYIHEHDDIPVMDVTLHNRGVQTAFPMRVQVEILDVGEFRYCDEENDPTRTLVTSSGTYDIMLSPTSKGKRLFTKIAHQLRADEADRFHLTINQDEAGWSLAYTWYCLRIAIFYDEPAHVLTSKPILLSLPPVGEDLMDIWGAPNTPCSEQNKATLRRMSELEATRSISVEDTIRQILGE